MSVRYKVLFAVSVYVCFVLKEAVRSCLRFPSTHFQINASISGRRNVTNRLYLILSILFFKNKR
jgi:hypothetical protein